MSPELVEHAAMARALWVHAVVFVALVILAPFVVWRWARLAGARAVAALVGVAVAHALIAGAFTSWGSWHPNQHGLELWAQVRHGELEAATSLGRLHGYAFYAVHRVLVRTGVDFFVLQLGLSALGVALAGLWASLATRRPWVGLTAAVLLASLPVRLRLAASDTMYSVAEVALLSACVAAVAWLRTGSWLQLGWGVAALSLSMASRLDALTVAPMLVVCGLLATGPGAVGELASRWRALVGATLWLALLLAVRLPDGIAALLGHAAAVRAMGSTFRDLCWRMAAEYGVAVALVLLARPWLRARWAGGAPRVGTGPALLALGALGVFTWVVPHGVLGAEAVFGGDRLLPLRGLALGNAVTTPPAWTLLAAVALARVAWSRPWLLVGTVPVVALMIGGWLAESEGTANFVRASALVQAPFAVGVAVGLFALVPWALRAWLLPLLVVGAVGQVAWAYGPFLAHRFPGHVDVAALQAGIGVLHEGAHVVVPTSQDLPACGVDLVGHRERDDAAASVLATVDPARVHPLGWDIDAALARGEEVFVVWNADCHRVVVAEDGREGRVVVGPTRYDAPRLRGASRTHRYLRVRPAPTFTLDDVVPCWQEPAPVAAGCAPVTCGPGVKPVEPGRLYVAPACAALAERYRLVPELELALGTENTEVGQEQVATAGGRVGLYRVLPKD